MSIEIDNNKLVLSFHEAIILGQINNLELRLSMNTFFRTRNTEGIKSVNTTINLMTGNLEVIENIIIAISQEDESTQLIPSQYRKNNLSFFGITARTRNIHTCEADWDFVIGSIRNNSLSDFLNILLLIKSNMKLIIENISSRFENLVHMAEINLALMQLDDLWVRLYSYSKILLILFDFITNEIKFQKSNTITSSLVTETTKLTVVK